MKYLVYAVCVILSLRVGSSFLSTNTNAPRHWDTIVVGLGSAGTTAASTLARAGRRVLALEAQGRVGGRVHTVPFGNGVVELGAEWIHGTVGNTVYDLAIANNITILAQVGPTMSFLSDGTRANHELVIELLLYGLNALNTPPEEPDNVGQFVTKRIKEYVKEKHPLLNSDEVDEVLHWIDLMMGIIDGTDNWGEASTASAAQELPGYLEMSWHKNGYKTFFELLLNTYNGGPGLPNLEIRLNTEVRSIIWPQDPAKDVVVFTADGVAYKARNVIVTVSLGVLKDRHTTLFIPSLPVEKTTAINMMSIGVVGKVVFSFQSAWWGELEEFGFVWRKEDRVSVPAADQWLTKIYGASSPLGSNNTLTFWTTGEATKLVETLPDDVVQEKIMWLVKRFMGKKYAVTEPTAMIRSSWYSNPYTRGSYTFDNVLKPLFPTARVDLAAPLLDSSGAPRVLFAGEATEPTQFSTVHDASETGYREANRLLALRLDS